MKQLLFLLSIALCMIVALPSDTFAQKKYHQSIKIDSDQDPDSLYVFLSETEDDVKYRQGKGKWTNVHQKRDLLVGYKEWEAYVTQASTSAPAATVKRNTLGGTITWEYTGVGVYTGTLTGAFPADSTFIGSSGFIDVAASGDNTYSIQRATDNTVVLKTYSDAGTTAANAMLTLIPIRFRIYHD